MVIPGAERGSGAGAGPEIARIQNTYFPPPNPFGSVSHEAPGSDGEDDVVESLFEVTGGAAVVVVGMLAGMALLLAGRGLFTRAFTPDQYGLFSLAFTVASILTVLATLGMWNGVARQVAFHGSEESDSELTPASIVTWGLLTAAVGSAAVGIVLYGVADPLARLFGTDAYALSFRVAALTIPGMAIVRVCTAVFRGFSRTGERVVFQDLLGKGLFPVLLGGAVAFGLGFEPALLSLPASLGLTAVAYVAYVVYADPAGFRSAAVDALRRPSDGSRLLAFSIPLLFASLLIQLMSWTDILMLGYFKTAADVGVYDAVRPLVRVVSIIWGSMIFMYTPAVSEFDAADDDGAVRRLYFSLTKWFASVTFPVVLTFLLFPGLVLSTVFGPEYVAGATALQVLAVAFFLGNVMGPNGATLTALGHTRAVMWANLVAAAANVALNVYLIPRYALVGAAAATAAALVARNVIRVAIVYRVSGAHSLRRPLLVPMTITLVAVLAADAVAGHLVTRPLHLLPALAGGLAVYLAALVGLDYVAPPDRRLVRRIADWRPSVP